MIPGRSLDLVVPAPPPEGLEAKGSHRWPCGSQVPTYGYSCSAGSHSATLQMAAHQGPSPRTLKNTEWVAIFRNA